MLIMASQICCTYCRYQTFFIFLSRNNGRLQYLYRIMLNNEEEKKNGILLTKK